MYQLTGITKTYRKGKGTITALDGVNLSISTGEWLAVQGLATGTGPGNPMTRHRGASKPPAQEPARSALKT